MNKFREKKYPARIIVYAFCLFIMSLGIAFFIKSNLGVSPASAVARALDLTTGMGMGLATVIFYSFLVLLQIILLRKKFNWLNLLQIPLSFVFGYLTEFCQWLLRNVAVPSNFFLQLLFMLIGALFLTFGIALYVNANVMPLAIDGFTKCVTDVTHKKFHLVKICVDVSVSILAAVICLIFIHKLGAFGVGTVFTAIFNGVFVGLWNKLLGKFEKKFLIPDEPKTTTTKKVATKNK